MSVSKRTMSLLLAMAVVALMALPAQASLVFQFGGDDAPESNAAEKAFFEALLGSDELFKIDANGSSGGITVTGINSTTGTVAWDLTGTGLAFEWVVVIDGKAGGPGEDKLYNVYSVTADQAISSNGPQNVTCCFDLEKGISHYLFFGGESGQQVPEPTTLLLLGAGIVGAVAARRRFIG
jgi:hypothetical protein